MKKGPLLWKYLDFVRFSRTYLIPPFFEQHVWNFRKNFRENIHFHESIFENTCKTKANARGSFKELAVLENLFYSRKFFCKNGNVWSIFAKIENDIFVSTLVAGWRSVDITKYNNLSGLPRSIYVFLIACGLAPWEELSGWGAELFELSHAAILIQSPNF